MIFQTEEKKKKATINSKNTDDKCFQYSVTVALNYEEIKRNLEIVSNIKPFLNKCNWKGINYPSKKITGKHLRKIIQENTFFIKEREICPAHIAKIQTAKNK